VEGVAIVEDAHELAHLLRLFGCEVTLATDLLHQRGNFQFCEAAKIMQQ
jgi:hypothetical protein